MYRVDFLVSNDRHHVDTVRPLLEGLGDSLDLKCRVVSLCEFRGLRTPVELRALTEGRVVRVAPPYLREVGYGRAGRAAAGQRSESFARRFVWRTFLWPRLSWIWSWCRPALVVLLNDVSYPYADIMRLLRRASIPTLLLQEGVRFPLPASAEESRWGTGGATAIAAWGAAATSLLETRGVDPARIHRVGAPRFDRVAPGPRGGRRSAGPRHILLVTNPIDRQGFCSTQEKLDLVRRFVAGATPFLEASDTVLLIRTHTGERLQDYQALIDGAGATRRLALANETPLRRLLEDVQAVVVLASTVGVEAILLDVPLGVLALPGGAFAHDYVSRGAAVGLRVDESLDGSLRSLLDGTGSSAGARQRYLEEHLATRTDATARTIELVRELLDSTREGSRVSLD